MSKIQGGDVMLFLNGTSIAFATNHTLEINTELSDFDCKDEGEQGWQNQEVAILNWNVTSDNIYSNDGQGENFIDLFDIMLQRLPIDAVFCKKAETFSEVPEGGWSPSDKPFKGKVIITDLQLNAPHGDYATYTATFEGVGELRDTSNDNYFYFEALQDAQFMFEQHDPLNPPIQYSIDNGVTWEELGLYEKTPIIHAGEKILWKGHEEQLHARYLQEQGIGVFSSTGNFKCGGNPLSIVFDESFGGIRDIGNYPNLFFNLFFNCDKLIDSSDIELRAIILSEGCYEFMFGGCTNMVKTVDVLPATRLAKDCYCSMYVNCQSLKKAPELPATILQPWCYQNMFANCYSLRETPHLIAPKAETYSYQAMFRHCRNLSLVYLDVDDYTAVKAVESMLQDVAPYGTIITGAYKPYTDILPTNWIRQAASFAFIPRIIYQGDGEEIDIYREYEYYLRISHIDRLSIGKVEFQIVESDGTVDYSTVVDVADKEKTVLPSPTITWEDKVYWVVLKSKHPTHDDINNVINCYPVGHEGGGSPIG